MRLHKNVPYRIEVKGSERSQPGGTINNPRIKIFAGRDELTLLNTSADGVSQTSSMTKARGGGATSTSGTNSRLEIKPDETDRYRLQVYGAAGDNGTYTITINALDRPQGRLASDITVDQENRNSVSISWTKSKKTQSYLRYPKTTYETFYRTWPDGEWVFGGGRISDPRTYTFTGLTPGTSYEVRVHMVPPPGLTTHINQWGYARVYTAN